MNLDTFFENFELFAGAPMAVDRMRELVLELAVQGKLVERESDDEEAEDLHNDFFIGRTQKRNHELAAGKQKGLAKIEAVDYPYEIPVYWKWIPLGIVTYIRTGKLDANASSDDGKYPFFTCARTPLRIDKYAYDCECVLLAGNGNFDVNYYNGKFEAYQRTYIIESLSSSLVLGRYLFRYMQLYAKTLRMKSIGGVISYIKIGFLTGAPFPLPPLAEQKRIVAKVDALMALCDRLDAQQRERDARHSELARASVSRFNEDPTPDNLKLLFHPACLIDPADLRKTILTLAVRGKLVPQHPEDEGAEALLKRVRKERVRLKLSNSRDLSAEQSLNFFECIVPSSWRWQSLEEILVFGPTNGASPKSVDYETGVRSLTLSATTSGRFKAEHTKFVPIAVPSHSPLWLKDGDILVQRGNTLEYVGVSAVYRGDPNQFIYPDLMMKLQVSPEIDVDFVHIAMSSIFSRDYLRSRASGTSGTMPKINQAALKSLPIPVPPLAEQRRIVARVEELMGLVDQLEAQIAASRRTAVALLEAGVRALTNGEL